MSEFQEYDGVRVVSVLSQEVLQNGIMNNPDDWKHVAGGATGIIVCMASYLPPGVVIVEFTGPLDADFSPDWFWVGNLPLSALERVKAP